MREFKYVPDICKGEKAKYEGFITLKVPSIIEKNNFVAEANFAFNEKGEIELNSETAKAFNRCVEKTRDYYLEVNIVNKKTKEKFTSFDDINYGEDDAFEKVLTDAATLILSRMKISKK